MIASVSLHRQRGATLIVGMIMLVVITVMVVSAFKLSTTNLQAVGNMQFRDQALAAAHTVIDNELEAAFYNNVADLINATRTVDIDNNGVNDFRVTIASLSCVRATPASVAASSSVTLPGMSTLADYNTIWDFYVTVADATAGSTGVSVGVHQGVRVLLSQAQCNSVCPPGVGLPCS